jgi:glycerophosphoryl diester phosphodiesterase
MWQDLASPSVIAHRGDKAHAPENTISAFKLAEADGADGIEFDVKLSVDGKVIILHDQTVDRTTNGTGNVAKLSLAALKELDAGVQFPGKFIEEKIPTLEEAFASLGSQFHMNIELTNYASPNDALVSKVVDLVMEYSMQNRVLFSSFLPRNLRIAKNLLPDCPRALLTLPGLLGSWGRIFGWHNDYFALHPNIMDVNSRMVKKLHADGKWINVWTVNKVHDIQRLIELDVDGIITDDPTLVLKCLGRCP